MQIVDSVKPFKFETFSISIESYIIIKIEAYFYIFCIGSIYSITRRYLIFSIRRYLNLDFSNESAILIKKISLYYISTLKNFQFDYYDLIRTLKNYD